ncbi:MAG: uL15 family ribosomal protein [Nanoarchaeota archaeon]
MVHRKRRKTTRMRGSHTHGWGDKKKRRNYGHAGGKGLAGRYTGSKKPSAWAMGRKHNIGFSPKNPSEGKALNIQDLNIMIENGKIQKKGSSYEANLTSLGYTKLLSKGKPKYSITIIINSATEKAVQKVSAAGGNVVLNTQFLQSKNGPISAKPK